MIDRWCGRLVPLFPFHTFYTCLSGLLWLRCSDLLHTVDISIYPYQRRKNPARNQNKNRFLQFCRLDTCHWDMHRKSLPMQKQHTFLFRSCNEMKMKMKIKRKNVRKNEYRTKQKCAKWNVSYALCRIYNRNSFVTIVNVRLAHNVLHIAFTAVTSNLTHFTNAINKFFAASTT